MLRLLLLPLIASSLYAGSPTPTNYITEKHSNGNVSKYINLEDNNSPTGVYQLTETGKLLYYEDHDFKIWTRPNGFLTLRNEAHAFNFKPDGYTPVVYQKYEDTDINFTFKKEGDTITISWDGVLEGKEIKGTTSGKTHEELLVINHRITYEWHVASHAIKEAKLGASKIVSTHNPKRKKIS